MPIPTRPERPRVRDPHRGKRPSLVARVGAKVEARASAGARVEVRLPAARVGRRAAIEEAGAAVGAATVVDVAPALDLATVDAAFLALGPVREVVATVEIDIGDLQFVAEGLGRPCLTGNATKVTATRRPKAVVSESLISLTIPGRKISKKSLGVTDR